MPRPCRDFRRGRAGSRLTARAYLRLHDASRPRHAAVARLWRRRPGHIRYRKTVPTRRRRLCFVRTNSVTRPSETTNLEDNNDGNITEHWIAHHDDLECRHIELSGNGGRLRDRKLTCRRTRCAAATEAIEQRIAIRSCGQGNRCWIRKAGGAYAPAVDATGARRDRAAATP